MSEYEARFAGVHRLYGREAVQRLREAHVCVVGLGGVGSWAVEALARTGIGKLTIVDFDDVCISNVNRQLPAISGTLGQLKVSVMRDRVMGINPQCLVHAREEFFTSTTADSLFQARFDCVLDAIDSVSSKCLLIARSCAAQIPVVTVGAAGGRKDPTAIRIAEITKISHDRLLQRVRKVLRRDHGFPRGRPPFGVASVYAPLDIDLEEEPEELEAGNEETCSLYGTAAFVTGAFGLAAASAVVSRLLQHRSE